MPLFESLFVTTGRRWVQSVLWLPRMCESWRGSSKYQERSKWVTLHLSSEIWLELRKQGGHSLGGPSANIPDETYPLLDPYESDPLCINFGPPREWPRGLTTRDRPPRLDPMRSRYENRIFFWHPEAAENFTFHKNPHENDPLHRNPYEKYPLFRPFRDLPPLWRTPTRPTHKINLRSAGLPKTRGVTHLGVCEEGSITSISPDTMCLSSHSPSVSSSLWK